MPINIPQTMLEMLVPVAEALGDELLPSVAFVGGSTTALLITDSITRQAVRFTEDVDLILNHHQTADPRLFYRHQAGGLPGSRQP